MSMIRFVLLGLVLFSTKVSSKSHLTKCCPPGEIFSGHSIVGCISKPKNAPELYIHWNTTARFQGIPQCNEPEDLVTTLLDDLDFNNFLEVPACLEILYVQATGENTVIVVHCRSNKDRSVNVINTSFPQLAYIRKCCPRDTVFDNLTKACVSRLSELNNLATFLLNKSANTDIVIVATEGPATCKGPIVDYEIDKNDIFVRNNTYSVMLPAFTNIKEELSVTESNACLDMTPNSVFDRTLVARVCRNPEFCDRNACIRKCCAENEFFYAQGCNELTVPDEPTEFHEALTNAVNQTKLSAFDTTKGKTAKETKEKLDKYYVANAPSDYTVKYFESFVVAATPLPMKSAAAGPPMWLPRKMSKKYEMVLADRKVKVRELADATKISTERTRHILGEILHIFSFPRRLLFTPPSNCSGYGVLIGKPCKYGMYPADPREEEWLLTSEGHVFIENYAVYDQDKYCMDVFYNKSEFDHSFHLFICFDKPETNEISVRYQMNTALQIISCAFLLMTLLVYLCLPSLQNLHGKTLMCHVSSLLLAFICLPVITWITPGNVTEEQSMTTCKALAYTMLFSFLSAFSWLNVMCFDIWWTFGFRGSTITKGREHTKRFLLYCLYAWGLSLLISIFAIVVDSTEILPDYLQPDIGNRGCWFTQKRDSYGELAFFIGPVMILLISNVMFFILTSIYCNKVKAEIKRVTADPTNPRSKRFRSDKKRFIMNIKLFVVMGMSWICEVVSFFLVKYLDYEHWHHVFFYTSDVFNCLQGLLIFILFVLKSCVYQALRKRLGFDTNKKKKSAPTCDATAFLHDPYRVKKSASNSTLTTTFAISSTP